MQIAEFRMAGDESGHVLPFPAICNLQSSTCLPAGRSAILIAALALTAKNTRDP
jgi:hypothetical protein